MGGATVASESRGDVPLSKVALLEGHEARVWHCAWRVNTSMRVQNDDQDTARPRSYTLATCGADKTVKLWTVSSSATSSAASAADPTSTSAPLATLQTTLDGSHTGTVRRICFSPDGSLLASASFDKTVVVWNVSDARPTDDLGDADDTGDELGAPLTVLEGHESEVKGVAWNPSGNGILATCGRDKTVWFWEQQGGFGGGVGGGVGGHGPPDLDPVDLVDLIDFEVIDVKHGHEQDVKAIVWHPSGELLVSVSYDDSIKFWRESDDTDEWECVRTVSNAHESTVWDVRFDEEGSHMVTSGDDCQVKVWKVDQVTASHGDYGSREVRCTCVATISGYHDRPIYSVDAVRGDSDGRLLVASGGGDDAVVVVEVDVSPHVTALDANDVAEPSGSLQDPPADKGGQGRVVVKAVVRGAHGQDVNCVRWRPREGKDDTYMLASCADDGTVAIWTFG